MPPPAPTDLVDHRRALAGLSLNDFFARDPRRFQRLSLRWGEWLVDLSRERLGADTLPLLEAHARSVGLENWIAAVEAGRVHIHGNWWCASVWSECRRMASSWISENICAFDAERFDSAARLSEVYSAVSVKLLRAGRKTLDSPARLVLLREVRALEEEAASILQTLV